MSERWTEKNEQLLIKKNFSLKNEPKKIEPYRLPNGKMGKIVWRSEDGRTIGVQVQENGVAKVYIVKVDSETP